MKRVDKLKKGDIVFDRKLDVSYQIEELTEGGYMVTFSNRDRTQIADTQVFCKREFFKPINHNPKFGVIKA